MFTQHGSKWVIMGDMSVVERRVSRSTGQQCVESSLMTPFHLVSVSRIVGKKRDPGILDPELFLAQIRKVEARLGKLAKIRKSVIN